jgi:hypothetical protein
MRTLADPKTRTARFFSELGDAVRVIAPVSGRYAHLFTTMADTFEAISRDPQALKDTIAKTAPTLDVGTRSLRVQRPFLDAHAALSRTLRRGRPASCAARCRAQPRAASRHARARALGRAEPRPPAGRWSAARLAVAPTTTARCAA